METILIFGTKGSGEVTVKALEEADRLGGSFFWTHYSEATIIDPDIFRPVRNKSRINTIIIDNCPVDILGRKEVRKMFSKAGYTVDWSQRSQLIRDKNIIFTFYDKGQEEFERANPDLKVKTIITEVSHE